MKLAIILSFFAVLLSSCSEYNTIGSTLAGLQNNNSASGGNNNEGQQGNPFGSSDHGQNGCVGLVYAVPAGSKKLPNFEQLEPLSKIVAENFDVPVRAFEEGFPGVPNLFEWFAIRYRCYIVAPVNSDYGFLLRSDDGSRLFIDGKLVVDNDGVHPVQDARGVVNLTAGKHYFELQYFQGPRYHIALQLFWKYVAPNMLASEIVPKTAFIRWDE